MKFKYILSAMAMVAIAKSSFAQYSQDAIRFSNTQTGSTARVKALGNANVALGGDLTSVSGNPAGLGFFTRSELSVTPEFDMYKAKSNYFGSTTNDKKNTGNLSNAAVVFYSRLNTSSGADKTKGWLSLNFGLGFSRTGDFYENTTYNGLNNNSSVTDYFASVNDRNSNDPLAQWAYGQFLIYDPDANNQYSRGAAITGVNQTSVITRTGGQSEFNLALGANYSNKLYIGGSLGIATVRYNSTTVFSERGRLSLDEDTNSPTTRDFTSAYTQDQVTRGTGANIKLGLIYKPVEALRVGFNFTSPTWYNMEDTYSEMLATQIGNERNLSNGPEVYNLNYDLRTPLKVAGGIAYFFKNYGFITGDVEYVDYSSAKLMHNDSYDATNDNNDIRTLYKGAVNTRVGAEARLGKFAYLRGGYNVLGNPMKDNGSNIKTATGGIGFRSGQYSVDATYMHSTGSNTVFPYEIGDASPSALINRTNDNLFLTLSYRF